MRCCAGPARRARQRRALVGAVASVCSPLDLAAGGHAIGRGFNRLVYTTMFLRSMKPKALAKLAQHPGLFDREALLAARDLYEFDNIFTAPLHGFSDTDDYYARASAKPHLHRIRIPALALNARNDPFVPARQPAGAGARSGDCVTLWQPAHGGHVGFPGGRAARARAAHARRGGRLAARGGRLATAGSGAAGSADAAACAGGAARRCGGSGCHACGGWRGAAAAGVAGAGPA